MGRGLPLDVEKVADVLAAQVVAAVGPLLERIKAMEAREQQHLARIGELEARKIPDAIKGDPGIDGKDGAPGTHGRDGKDGVAGKDGAAGERGDPGKDGPQGIPGRDGRDGAPGLAGKDGVNGSDGRAGIDGKDGTHGKDGTGWDDLAVEYDGVRTFKFVTVKGDQRKDHGSFVVPLLIYRGVFSEGEFEKGDVVTWAGALWHCNEPTSEKPGDGSKSWTLAVKKGRDGRDGVMKPPPSTGPLKL